MAGEMKKRSDEEATRARLVAEAEDQNKLKRQQQVTNSKNIDEILADEQMLNLKKTIFADYRSLIYFGGNSSSPHSRQYLALSSGRFAGSKSQGVGRWAPATTRFIAFAPNIPFHSS